MIINEFNKLEGIILLIYLISVFVYFLKLQELRKIAANTTKTELVEKLNKDFKENNYTESYSKSSFIMFGLFPVINLFFMYFYIVQIKTLKE